jgi:hypothetical protein
LALLPWLDLVWVNLVWVDVLWLEAPWLVVCCGFSFFGFFEPWLLVVVVPVAVVEVVVAAAVVMAHAPMLSPCAMCAGTAGAAMLIVCSPPLPVL